MTAHTRSVPAPGVAPAVMPAAMVESICRCLADAITDADVPPLLLTLKSRSDDASQRRSVRLTRAVLGAQDNQGDGRPLLRIVADVMAIAHGGSSPSFVARRTEVNALLVPWGYRVREDGKVAKTRAGPSAEHRPASPGRRSPGRDEGATRPVGGQASAAGGYWFHAVNEPRTPFEHYPATATMIIAAAVVVVVGLFDGGVGEAFESGWGYILLVGLVIRIAIYDSRGPLRARQEAELQVAAAQARADWERWFSKQPPWKRELILAEQQQRAQADLARKTLFAASMIASMHHNNGN